EISNSRSEFFTAAGCNRPGGEVIFVASHLQKEPTMKRYFLALGLIATACACAWGAYLRGTGTGGEMIGAADKLLETLSAEQKAKVVMTYDAPERVDWHFIPKATRKGMQIKEMNESQRKAAHALLQSAL